MLIPLLFHVAIAAKNIPSVALSLGPTGAPQSTMPSPNIPSVALPLGPTGSLPLAKRKLPQSIMPSPNIPFVTLHNGVRMPSLLLGMGPWCNHTNGHMGDCYNRTQARQDVLLAFSLGIVSYLGCMLPPYI